MSDSSALGAASAVAGILLGLVVAAPTMALELKLDRARGARALIEVVPVLQWAEAGAPCPATIASQTPQDRAPRAGLIEAA